MNLYLPIKEILLVSMVKTHLMHPKHCEVTDTINQKLKTIHLKRQLGFDQLETHFQYLLFTFSLVSLRT